MTQVFIEDLEGLYSKYRKSGDWKSAASCARQLIALKPDFPDYYRMAGRACAWSGYEDAIPDYYEKFLTKFHGRAIPDLVAVVRESLPVGLEPLESSYEYLGGKNSFGAIVHRTQGKIAYYTKIQAQSSDAKRELIFYQEILQSHPDLRGIAPEFVSAIELDGLIYLTLSFVQGRKAAETDLDQVVEACMRVTEIDRNFSDHLSRKSARYSLKPGTLGAMVPFFAHIESEAVNVSLIRGLEKIAAAGTHAAEVLDVIGRVSRAILDGKAYLRLEVERDFSILHGDFLSGNIMIDPESGSAKIIDWSSLVCGLKSMDMALYLCRSGYDFSVIKKHTLDAYPEFFDSPVSRLFFLYMVVAMNINLMSSSESRRQQNSKILADTILPAVKGLEAYATDLL